MQVSELFVDQLFANHHFNTLLIQFHSSQIQQSDNQPKVQLNNELTSINKVIQDINMVLYNACKQTVSAQCSHHYKFNQYLLTQIQMIKSKIGAFNPSQHPPSQKFPQQKPLSTQIFFYPDIDLQQIRQGIGSLQQELQSNHKSLIHSFQMYEEPHDTSRENNQLQFDLQFKLNQKLNEETKKIEQEINLRIQKFENSIEKRVQQLKKTITKVVQAMNDPTFWLSHNKFQTPSKENQNPESMQFKTVFAKENQRNSLNCSIKNERESQTVESPTKLDRTLPPNSSDNRQEQGSGSNRKIDSLNKSFNFGKTKIKSLFGFKTSTKPSQSAIKISQ